MIYFDTETCGFHGPTVLIQWAEDSGPVHLHEVFMSPIKDTLALIEKICANEIVGFNLAFDWFHLCQTYTTLSLFPNKDYLPYDYIAEYIEYEEQARDGPCLKPVAACDLMLHARKGPFQSTMERKPIVIKKIPNELAWHLAEELEQRIQFNGIYFSRRAKPGPIWQVEDIKNKSGEVINPNFKNVVCRFAPSTALKALAVEALGLDPIKFKELESPDRPLELGFAPFAKAVMSLKSWSVKEQQRQFKMPFNGSWPYVIEKHIMYWRFNQKARQYAEDDITITRDLHAFFEYPVCGDTDSELACMVGAIRWSGYSVDLEKVKKLLADLDSRIKDVPTAPNEVRHYIFEVMDEIERISCPSTKKQVLEELATWPDHPVAIRAANVLETRKLLKERELYVKLLIAGRFHASFKVIGALSSRMSGADSLNAQGIKRAKSVRKCFTLKQGLEELSGGDFDAFEIAIFAAVSNEPKLDDILRSGKKIHATFGTFFYEGKTYDEIKNDEDLYSRSKSGLFALVYGGNENTLQERLGIPTEAGQKGMYYFFKEFPGVGKERSNIESHFSPLSQPEGIGSRIYWKDPDEYVSSMLGFRRYFTIEWRVCKALFDLAQKPPKHWQSIKTRVVRRERVQTCGGAAQSAVYAAAFNIQSAVIRQAINHRIQSTGAGITKETQAEVWKLQPCGVSPFLVKPMNVHDELLAPHLSCVREQVKETVYRMVSKYKEMIPFLKIEWKNGANNWADLK